MRANLTFNLNSTSAEDISRAVGAALDKGDLTVTKEVGGTVRVVSPKKRASPWRRAATAPVGVNVIAWSGGVRLMRLDDMGQWRNMLGAPKRAPTHWMPLPDAPR